MSDEYKLCDKCGENETARVIDGEYVCGPCFRKSRESAPSPEEAATAMAKVRKEKPEVIPNGMFWCSRCNSLHRIASKTGGSHLKYREEG